MKTTPGESLVIRAIVTDVVATAEQLSDVAVFQPLLDQRARIHDMIESVRNDQLRDGSDSSA